MVENLAGSVGDAACVAVREQIPAGHLDQLSFAVSSGTHTVATPECPPDDALRNYMLGGCSDAISEEIEGHLTHCAACEATLAQFDSADDTLMRHLPLAGAVGGNDAQPAPGWIDVLRQQRPPDGPAGRQDGHLAVEARTVASGEAPQLPDGFANYELLGVIGRGGMGIVFLARHRQLNRRVALKVVRPEALSSAEARRRFQREIQILGGLNHPGIVMATDAGAVGTSAYLVMELIDGADLGRVVREGGPLTIEAACDAGRQIAEALAAAHAAGAVHRDVKPSNAMVDHSGRVRLLDFGLANMTRLMHESGETSVGRLLGTLDYMAPEQTDGQQPVDARADLYGLGATLFFLLTGRPPHGMRAGRSILDQLRAVSHDDAPPVSSLRVDFPPDLDALLARLLSRDPESRPTSAAEVAVALADWAGGNLAARVADITLRSPSPDTESADSAAARQSLVELLGTGGPRPSSGAVAAPPAMVTPSARRKRLWRWTAMASLAGIVLAGVTIWLKTRQGTLKIESEAGDLTVEVLDEQDQVRELKIKKGKNETILDAGKYRVRLAGAHDGLELDRDVITLRRGDESVAKITRVASNEKGAAALVVGEQRVIGEERAQPALAERLFQGKSESEWLRLFAAETAPVSKLEAASALLVLAAELRPPAQLERILDLGEEIVRASFGDASIEFAFEEATNPPIQAPRWRLNESGPLYQAYSKFQQDLNDQVRKLPAADLARGLPRAVVKGMDARAAFATSLLNYAAISRIASDPAAAETVVQTLDVPLTGLNRSAICLVLRTHYVGKAPADQRQRTFSALQVLAAQLCDAPAGRLRDQMRDELMLAAQRLHGPDSPAELATTLARLVLAEIVENPNAVDRRFPFNNLHVTGSRPPYGSEYVAYIRKESRHVRDAWLPVVNDRLEQHPNTPADATVYSLVMILDMVLQAYSDGDEWPVEKTGALLTDMLRACYADPVTAQGHDWERFRYRSTTATLLTQIVRVTGEIPDFVQAGPRSSAAVVPLLKDLERRFKSREEVLDLAGFIDEAPYDTIRICLDRAASPTDLLNTASKRNMAARNLGAAPRANTLLLDPLLFLAILTDLAGESEVRDARIAKLLNDGRGRAELNRACLRDLLSGSLKVRPITLKLLQKMAASSKSEELTRAVRELLPPPKDQ